MENKVYKNIIRFQTLGCPPATQDINLNLENRQYAIDNAMYGPLDIKNPGDYWDKIAEKWRTNRRLKWKRDYYNWN